MAGTTCYKSFQGQRREFLMYSSIPRMISILFFSYLINSIYSSYVLSFLLLFFFQHAVSPWWSVCSVCSNSSQGWHRQLVIDFTMDLGICFLAMPLPTQGELIWFWVSGWSIFSCKRTSRMMGEHKQGDRLEQCQVREGFLCARSWSKLPF